MLKQSKLYWVTLYSRTNGRKLEMPCRGKEFMENLIPIQIYIFIRVNHKTFVTVFMLLNIWATACYFKWQINKFKFWVLEALKTADWCFMIHPVHRVSVKKVLSIQICYFCKNPLCTNSYHKRSYGPVCYPGYHL